MLRNPIGKYKVGVCQIDTEEYGKGEWRRKGTLLFYFPSETGTVMCPYKNANYQKEMAKQNEIQNGVDTFCYIDGELSNSEDVYPVILYNHGVMGYQMECTTLCADLASNGYIVVSVGHPFGSSALTYADGSFFPSWEEFKTSGENLKKLGKLWLEDIKYAMDYLDKINNGIVSSIFTGRMKCKRNVWMVGSSFGGCVGISMALCDDRISGAINLDGGLFLTINNCDYSKPIMIMCRPINMYAYLKLKMKKCRELRVEKIKKITHFEFTDGIYFSEKGKKNRGFADSVSRQIGQTCVKFISEHK